jgi:hypothetical protein
MDVSPWLLSADSFIVVAALSATVSLRHGVPLIALFGLCDAVASLLAQSMGTAVAPSWLAPAFLIAGGAAGLLNMQWITRSRRHLGIAYSTPVLMAIDNLFAPTRSPLHAGIASALMAALGMAAGLFLLRAIGRRASCESLPGTLLVTAGVLLAG